MSRLIKAVLFLAFIFVSIFQVCFSGTFKVKAYIVPNGAQSEVLADNELQFIKAIYNLYISGTSKNFDSIFANSYNYDKNSGEGFSGFYRAMCSQVYITAISEGDSLNFNHPYIQYFNKKYSSIEFGSIYTSKYQHVKPAPVFDCLLAVNSIRDILPKDKRDIMLTDISSFIKKIVADIDSNGGFPGYYEKLALLNFGDSQAEESMIVSSLLLLASQTLPSSGAGAITEIERSSYLSKSIALAKGGYSKCSGACSIRSNTGLVINHQMDPSILYTLSLLTGYSEIAMVYNQLGNPLPTNLFDSNLKNSLNTISNNLKNYLNPNYTIKGSFNSVNSSGAITDVSNYDQMKYRIDSNLKYPINSSVPIENIDTMVQFLTYDKKYIFSYTYKDNNVWHFRCDLSSSNCSAYYQDTVFNNLNTVTRKPDNSDGWNAVPIPTKADAYSQFYLPNKSDLKRYFISGDKIWHYICFNYPASTNCQAQYVKSLSSAWSGLANMQNWSVPAPSSNIDSFSQFIVPNTRTLKSYIYKGDRVWAYICLDLDTPTVKCEAFYTKTLAESWAGISGTWLDTELNAVINPPSSNLDAFYQYYAPDGVTLKSYAVKGDRVWAYVCDASCRVFYTKKLSSSFIDVLNQHKWSTFSDTAGIFKTYTGVGDWGFDATIQNSAFSTLYIIDPNLNYSFYNNLQSEQKNRGRTVNPYFPVNYVNNSWDFKPFIGTKYSISAKYLTSGWRQINPTDGIMMKSPVWQIATQDERVNSHWWFNILDAKNHSVAYLSLTNKKILGKFTPYSKYDLNQDGLVNINDIFELIRFIFGITSLNTVPDFNSDGRVGLDDLIYLLYKI